MEDTIVAIATAVGRSSISVLRVSGEECYNIVQKIFSKDIVNQKGYTLTYGWIKDGEKKIDSVLLSCFKAPHSFTGEDIIEINCHGGSFVTNEILKLLLNHGCRMAEAGEFSKRAFLNGKIDLSEAEAIINIIDADSKKSLEMANMGISGAISSKIDALQQKLVSLMAHIEVNIDYPEYEDENKIEQDEIIPALQEIKNEIDKILEHEETSSYIQSGIKTAIIGKPNAGKSTLLNQLCGYDRAIVTSVAGTTRDTVDATMTLDGLVYHLIDTAGLHETSDIVEREGINRSYKALEKAQLVLLVMDASQSIDEDDVALIKESNNKKRIIILNKTDKGLNTQTITKIKTLTSDKIIMVSLNNDKKETVKTAIKELFREDANVILDDTYIGNARQVEAIHAASRALDDAYYGALRNIPIDLLEVDLEDCRRELGRVTGKDDSEDVINEVFSKFCVGK